MSFRPAALGALLCCGAAAGVGCTAETGDAPGGAGGAGEPATWQLGAVSVVQYPGSAWHIVEQTGQVVAQHRDRDLQLLVDPTNSDDDQRYAGVYLIEGGEDLFTGSYYGSHCSTFVPDRPHVDQTEVVVTAADEALTVEMSEGSLAEMVDAQFDSDEPFRWISTWSLSSQGLQLQARGLYYLLVPKQSCHLTLLGEGGVELGSVQIEDDTSPLLEYYEDVRTIDIASAALGELSATTDAEIVQVEVTSYPNTSLFELDFDHSFKDRGQLEVSTRLTLPLDR